MTVVIGLVVCLAVLALAAWLHRPAFPRMDDRQIDVLGCLWQVPRMEGESYRRYRRRLARAAPMYRTDR